MRWNAEPVTLIELAREARDYAHNPYDEPKEGAAVVASNGEEHVAVPGILVENGNYTNTRTAAETAIFNALTRGYEEIKQLAVSRDTERVRPLPYTTLAVCDTFLDNATHVTIQEEDETETYRYDSIARGRPKRLAPELAADAIHDIQFSLENPQISVDEYLDDLVELARGNMPNAYNPSSGYGVGAVLLDAEGTVHPGNNIEPDKPSNDIVEVEKRAVAHGEETAILHWKTFSDADPIALAVASRDGGNCCGYCTQWMAEFLPDDLPIINVSSDDYVEHRYKDIDPHPFRLNLDA